jgi:hypothetical protein
MSFVFYRLNLRCHPIPGHLRKTLAPAMPRPAIVDSQGFESGQRQDRAVHGKIAYHVGDKRLTDSDRQTDVASASGPHFQGAATPRSWHYSRHGTCAVFKPSAGLGIV